MLSTSFEHEMVSQYALKFYSMGGSRGITERIVKSVRTTDLSKTESKHVKCLAAF